MTQPDAELHDSRNKQLKAEVEWRKKIKRWRDLLDGRQSAQAAKNLRAIDDPMAITGLAERLVKKPDTRANARLIYVEALAHINTHEARCPLAVCAMDDAVEEVRLSSLDELAKEKDDGVTAYFVGRMRNKHASNADINRAGVALGRIKDPNCIDTLIQYLRTGHEQVIQPGSGPGQMTTTFSKNGGGGGGMSMNQKPKKVTVWCDNQGVLDALVDITGQNFGFDQRAWQTWYTSRKAKGESVTAKRTDRSFRRADRQDLKAHLALRHGDLDPIADLLAVEPLRQGAGDEDLAAVVILFAGADKGELLLVAEIEVLDHDRAAKRHLVLGELAGIDQHGAGELVANRADPRFQHGMALPAAVILGVLRKVAFGPGCRQAFENLGQFHGLQTIKLCLDLIVSDPGHGDAVRHADTSRSDFQVEDSVLRKKTAAGRSFLPGGTIVASAA